MKNIARWIMAIIALMIVSVAVAAMVPSAATADNIIYISDTGSGDGSSANNPLGPETRVTRAAAEGTDAYKYYYAVDANGATDATKKFHFNSVLYQAAEKLAKTGGRIVIVGDVKIGYSTSYSGTSTIDRDFFMPNHGNNTITISAQKGAKLIITEGAHISLGGKTVFENMTFATGKTDLSVPNGVKNRLICCYGYETVFGQGINCINLDGDTSADYFPSIAGARRYGNNTCNPKVTVRSGVWGHVYGGNRGNANNVHTGNITLNLEGGTYLGYIIGSQKENRAVHAGNLNLNISGGIYKGPIYAESDKGVSQEGYKANIKITNGEFSEAAVVKKYYGATAPAYMPNVTLDLTECRSSALSLNYLLEGCDADTVLYPMAWNTGVEIVSKANAVTCGQNRKYDGTGLKLKLSFTIGSKNYTNELDYSSSNPYFEFDCDSSLQGEATVTCKYAGVEYDSYDVIVTYPKTIYISNTGTGTGSSAASPLGPTVVITRDAPVGTDAYNYYYAVDANGASDSTKKFHFNSVLYQAAEKLAETGGQIVLVGDVTLDYSTSYSGSSIVDRDFFMPDHGDNLIYITAQNGAKLNITEGVHFTFGGNTYIDNVEIVTSMTNRLMCCNGNKVVLGENIVCSNTANSTSRTYFITVAGGHRYGNATYDTDLTIKGGTWNDIYGSNRGNAGSVHKGDVNLSILGGTFKGVINAGANTGKAVHSGNVNLFIGGGTFAGDIYVCSSMGNGYKNSVANVKINGGTFASGSQVLNHYQWVAATTGYAPYLTLDLSECKSSNAQIEYLLTECPADKIIYPAKWCTKATIKTEPKNSVCFLNEPFDASGLVLDVTYRNGKTATVAYSDNSGGFKFSIDSTSLGTKTMSWRYGNVAYKTTQTEVINVPTPELLGAQIGVNSQNIGGLRFVAEVKKPYGSGVNVTDYGFIALDDTYLTKDELIKSGTLYGINIKNISANGTVFRPENQTVYNNNMKMTFSGVYPNLVLSDYNKQVAAIAYVKFTYNGKTYVRYSDVVKRSILGVADEALNSSLESESNKDWIRANVVVAYENYNAGRNDLVDSAKATELRNKVMQVYNEAITYKWTPSSDIDLDGTVFKAGTTYYGMPYVNNRKATLSEFKSHITTIGGNNVYVGPILGYQELYEGLAANATNEKTFYEGSVQPYLEHVDNGYTHIEKFFPGCDYSLIVNAWNSVGTNATWPVSLSSFIPSSGKGTVPVGNYDSSASKTDTKTIVDANGQTVMYAAYAACKPGDVLLNISSKGRSLWVVSAASSGENVTVSHGGVTLVTKNDGYSNYTQNKTYTFANLYDSGFIPVTIPELATGLQTQTSAVLTGFDGDLAMKTGVMNGVIESNRQIISVNVSIKRGSNAIYDKTIYYNSASDMNTNRVYLTDFDIANTVKYLVEKKSYVLSVKVEIGKEGVITLVQHTYTAPAIDYSKYSYYKTFALPTNLEQAAIDHMWDQFNIEWTPQHNIFLTGASSFNLDTMFLAGKTYKGVMYSNTRATLDEFNSVLTTSGGKKVMPVDITGKETKVVGGKTYYVINWDDIVGNHCSAAMYHAYQQSSRMYDLSRRNPNMRILGLSGGDYFYEMGAWVGDTRSVTKVYGEQAMYEVYAQIEKGDFIYKNARGGGHTRLIDMNAYVVRDANGKIDPDKSYITCVEQTDTLESTYSGSDGTTDWTSSLGYDTTWFMDHKYTFRKLFNGNCVIYRPTEFITNETEQAYVGLTSTITPAMLTSDNGTSGTGIQGIVESNYPLRRVTVKLYNTSTGALVTTAEKKGLQTNYSYNLANFKNTLNVYGLPAGNYKIVVTAEIAKGVVDLATVSFTK